MAQRNMPIGYKLVEGKVRMDESKADTVKIIFRNYANGASLHKLSKELTEAGFLNASNETNWYHGSVARILDNVKYLGDGFYPELIDEELFGKVQARRKEQCENLGRHLQYNSESRRTVFTGILRCGECGDIYKKYVEHSNRPSRRTYWKCKRYIHQNRVCCTNSFLTEEQIKKAFLLAANRIIARPQCLKRTLKKEPVIYNPEYVQLDREIKELEAQGRYSSKELPALIFKRAQAFYKTARIDDAGHNAEKMWQAFEGRQPLTEFNKELFQIVTRRITVHREGKLVFEFINGLTVETAFRVKNSQERMEG